MKRQQLHGRGLRVRRTSLGWRGQDLAEQVSRASGIHVSLRNISDWETGRRKPPLELWEALARVLKVRRYQDLAKAPRVG